MVKKIKKELEELKHYQNHMDNTSPVSGNSTENFNGLLELASRTNSRLKIEGDHKVFDKS
jgi:hypothetical protein